MVCRFLPGIWTTVISLASEGEMELGVLILRLGDWTRQQAEDRLRRVLEEMPEESFRNAIVVVERQRVRIRRLPIS